MLLLVEVPTDSQVLVDVPTDSRVLVDTEMPTMEPVVLIGTLPADRPGISPAGLVGSPWGSWIITSQGHLLEEMIVNIFWPFVREV